jgi:1-acyl-sn-glycerol-3-phosphate acyltransferase
VRQDHCPFADWVLVFRVQFEGLEHMPTQGPVLLVANHTSLLDIPAIHMRLKPWIYWVSKKELFKAPVIGSFFAAMGCIPVDRHKVDLHAARGISVPRCG